MDNGILEDFLFPKCFKHAHTGSSFLIGLMRVLHLVAKIQYFSKISNPYNGIFINVLNYYMNLSK